MVEYVYRLWIHFWNKPDTDLPKSWKWRWLHQLPKCIQDLMGFSDYRPLMLCEVLRKLWSNSVIIRIMDAWHQHGILEDTDHAYMLGRGTDTATIILQNYIDDIEE